MMQTLMIIESWNSAVQQTLINSVTKKYCKKLHPIETEGYTC